MTVFATSEAQRGCACIVGQPISYTCSVSMLRLDSIVWHCSCHLGWGLVGEFTEFTHHRDSVLEWVVAETVVEAAVVVGV